MKKLIFFLFAVLATTHFFCQEDHSAMIEGPFDSPQSVTETCLMCHDNVASDLMKSRHWNWLGDEITKPDGSKERIGKQNIINNFCIAVPSNWPRCTSCHISFGWKDETFDFSDSKNIDCLVCHDKTGTYKKIPTGAGMPDANVDLLAVAKSVGKTGINNCSVCHFNGGGGTGVKHGDMDGSMINPSPDLDVHMGLHGFTCAKCHAGENHNIFGAGHGSMASGNNHISCSNCHKENIHKNKVLNNHIASVACETCHIPTFARQEPTKIWWDWSLAGQDKTDVPDESGMQTYDKKKGEFRWAKNVVPEYRWYNGKADYYRFGDKIEPGQVLRLNVLAGNINDSAAKISPFKLMKGKQIYDSENNYLIVPKLFGDDGYWSTYDWNSASELGMKSIQLAYSGKFGFVETEMYWPINHMVAPASKALKCTACHSQSKNRILDWEALGYEGDPMSKGGRKMIK